MGGPMPQLLPRVRICLHFSSEVDGIHHFRPSTSCLSAGQAAIGHCAASSCEDDLVWRTLRDTAEDDGGKLRRRTATLKSQAPPTVNPSKWTAIPAPSKINSGAWSSQTAHRTTTVHCHIILPCAFRQPALMRHLNSQIQAFQRTRPMAMLSLLHHMRETFRSLSHQMLDQVHSTSSIRTNGDHHLATSSALCMASNRTAADTEGPLSK